MEKYPKDKDSCISPRSQGLQTLLIFWWTKYVQLSSISVYSERIIPASLGRRPILRYQVLKVP